MTNNRPKPVVLVILDGWGVAAEMADNAIAIANTPNFNKLVATYPAMTLKVLNGQASSEAGHFVLGTGLPWYQDQPVAKAHLPKIISQAKLTQFYIAETEKYAQINYFFKGCQEERVSGAVMEVVPSLHLASQAEEPAMAAKKITKTIIKKIVNDQFDFMVANFANPHLVAVSGDKKLTAKAVEIVDKCLSGIIKSVLAKDGVVIVTADHGKAEELRGINSLPFSNPVPFIIASNYWEGKNAGKTDVLDNDLSLLEPVGELIDVAPTILKIMGLPIPKEMIGRPLI